LLSRNSRDLGPWFPELLQAAQSLPVGTLLDGEIVISDDNGAPDFGALQARLSSARNDLPRVVHERAAVLVAFDMLEKPAHHWSTNLWQFDANTSSNCLAHDIPACSSSSTPPT
jgi:DNA ligase 1